MIGGREKARVAEGEGNRRGGGGEIPIGHSSSFLHSLTPTILDHLWSDATDGKMMLHSHSSYTRLKMGEIGQQTRFCPK